MKNERKKRKKKMNRINGNVGEEEEERRGGEMEIKMGRRLINETGKKYSSGESTHG